MNIMYLRPIKKKKKMYLQTCIFLTLTYSDLNRIKELVVSIFDRAINCIRLLPSENNCFHLINFQGKGMFLEDSMNKIV